MVHFRSIRSILVPSGSLLFLASCGGDGGDDLPDEDSGTDSGISDSGIPDGGASDANEVAHQGNIQLLTRPFGDTTAYGMTILFMAATPGGFFCYWGEVRDNCCLSRPGESLSFLAPASSP